MNARISHTEKVIALEPPPTGPHRRPELLGDDETRIIAAVLGAASTSMRLSVPAGDDAAVLLDKTALTVDTLVEGVHWDDRLSPSDVGFKAVAVSVSDLAAMCARPQWMLVSLSLPRTGDIHSWVGAFASGMAEAGAKYGVTLVGGDTTRSPGPRVVSVTMGGRCAGPPLRRDGANVGDKIWVTGTLGLAGAGYQLASPPEAALAALRRPSPPLAFALEHAKRLTAGMDLSDGLAVDLPRLCRASGVGARVWPSLLPLHPQLSWLDDPVDLQVGAGEDYQLLITADPAVDLTGQATAIGEITEAPSVELCGRSWPKPWSHFGGDA